MQSSQNQPSALNPAFNIRTFMSQHSLLSFFVIALGISWGYGLPCLGFFHLPLLPWILPLGISPTLAALIMSWVTEGKAGMSSLLRSYIRWHVGWQWYLFTLFGIPAIILFSFLIFPGSLSGFHFVPGSFFPLYLKSFAFTFLLGGPLFEEPGWRGFALPRLQQHLGPLRGSLLLGVLWGLWHLPLFLVPGYNGAGQGLIGVGLPFVEFLITICGFSVILAWIFNNTRGSLLMTMFAHASVNMDKLLLSLFPVLAATSMVAVMNLWAYAFIVLTAIVLLIVTRSRLSFKYEKLAQKSS